MKACVSTSDEQPVGENSLKRSVLPDQPALLMISAAQRGGWCAETDSKASCSCRVIREAHRERAGRFCDAVRPNGYERSGLIRHCPAPCGRTET